MSEPIHGELLDIPPAGSRRRESFDDFYAAELPRLVAYRRWREVGALEHAERWVRRTRANLAVSQFRRRMVELRVTARLSVRRPVPDELDEASEEFWSAVRALPAAATAWGPVPSFAWAPDGSALAYTRVAGPVRSARSDGVHLIRPDGTGHEKLSAGEGSLAWQPAVSD